jgi:hypothetical protein
MLDKTDHPAAPWIAVEAENKRWARVRVLESVVDIAETALQRNGLTLPPAPSPKPPRRPAKS